MDPFAPVSRMAPTPSGFLHAGNGLNFILTWLLVRSKNGKLFLRIDDLDAPRMRPGYVEDIFQTLDWLGLSVDEGPDSVESLTRTWSQHHRLAEYEALLAKMVARDLVFPCAKSRTELQSEAMGGRYPSAFRAQGLSLAEPGISWRMKTDDAALVPVRGLGQHVEYHPLSDHLVDFVIRRKDGIPAYQVASVVDDTLYGVNLIVRGLDLLDSSVAQVFLAKKMGMEAFAQTQFYHHPLLLDHQGNKLGKSAGASSLRSLREQHASPAIFLQQIAAYLGLPKRPYQRLNDLLDEFSWPVSAQP